MELRKGGDAYDWFFQAMAHWQKGDKDEARKWFDKAVAWTRQKAPKNVELRRFWAEAAELLGQPGPDAVRSGRSQEAALNPDGPAASLDGPIRRTIVGKMCRCGRVKESNAVISSER